MKTSKHIVMANELIRSAQGLNLGEKRLLMLAISKLDSQSKPTLQNATTTLSVSELVQAFDLNPDKAYQEAKKAAEGIMKRQIRLKPDDGNSELIQWVGRTKYSKGEGWLLIEFYQGVFPYLFELQKHFTIYKLSRASALRSVYSWRLFELLAQFKKTGSLNISLDEFRHALEVPSAYESDFSWLRMRVIEPAVKEIRAKDGLAVEWETIKAGRKVKALRFTFPTEQQTKLPLECSRVSVVEPKRKTNGQDYEKLSQKEALSRYTGALNLAKLSNQTIDALVSAQELEAFKYYSLI